MAPPQMAEQRTALACLISVLSIIAAGCPVHVDEPAPPKGGISLSVEPTAARVYVDGQLVGTAATYAGGHLPLHPGHYRIKLVAEGWFDEYLEIDVGDEIVPLGVDMVQVPEPLGVDPP